MKIGFQPLGRLLFSLGHLEELLTSQCLKCELCASLTWGHSTCLDLVEHVLGLAHQAGVERFGGHGLHLGLRLLSGSLRFVEEIVHADGLP